jgi:nucleoside-diphosphate-sugar epimerase
MIIGSGLIAQAFFSYSHLLQEVCVYAAGVSNSLCKDAQAFSMDRQRLEKTLISIPNAMPLVYFSTCSIDDPSSQDNAYVAYKKSLEVMLREHGNYLVVRLPQVVGGVFNQHTLLNYLTAKVRKFERFDLWRSASRNVIDINDVAQIVLELVLSERARKETINVAATRRWTMLDIVSAIERVTGCTARYNLIERGADYDIDTSRIAVILDRCGIYFDDGYLIKVLRRYYGPVEATNFCLG